MASVSLNLDTRGWQRALRSLQVRAPQAIARALNRAAGSASTIMVRSVATDMGLKQADVKARIATTPARADDLRAAVIATGARVPLMKFNARDRFPRGVVARLPGGAGRYPHAFIRTMRSGHTGVFARVGDARLPITELHGPSIPAVFVKYLPAGLARAEEQLAKNLVSELRFVLRQAAA